MDVMDEYDKYDKTLAEEWFIRGLKYPENEEICFEKEWKEYIREDINV